MEHTCCRVRGLFEEGRGAAQHTLEDRAGKMGERIEVHLMWASLLSAFLRHLREVGEMFRGNQPLKKVATAGHYLWWPRGIMGEICGLSSSVI